MTIQPRELTALIGHDKAVYTVAFSPDGSLLASASGDGEIKLWKLPGNGSEVATFTGHRGFVFSVDFSPDGKLLASGSYDDTIRLWKIPEGGDIPGGEECLAETLTGHWGAVYSVAFSLDGVFLASSSGIGTIKLWKMTGSRGPTQGGTPWAQSAGLTLEGHNACVRAVAFSPDGTRLASASDDKTVKLWEIGGEQSRGRLVETLTGHSMPILAVAFSPGNLDMPASLWSGGLLASASWDTTIRLWDAKEGSPRLTLKDNNQGLHSVAFSPDGRLMAFSSYHIIKVMEIPGGEVTTVTGHEGWVYSVAFSPDGKMLASASGDKTVKLWGLE